LSPQISSLKALLGQKTNEIESFYSQLNIEELNKLTENLSGVNNGLNQFQVDKDSSCAEW